MTNIIRGGGNRVDISLLPPEHEDFWVWRVSVLPTETGFYISHSGGFYNEEISNFTKDFSDATVYENQEVAIEKAEELAETIEIGGIHVSDFLRLDQSGEIGKPAVVEELIRERLFKKTLGV